jgi:LmbE family N-acetylglucosaminyl deacetylase
MAKTVLATGAHYDDGVFGIPGILLQAARKHYRIVILSLIGDYSNWSSVKGREKEFVADTIQIGKEYGAEMRYLDYASNRFDVTLEAKRAGAPVVAEVRPDLAFLMWPHDRHHDQEVAATLSNIALRHGNRVWDRGPGPAPESSAVAPEHPVSKKSPVDPVALPEELVGQLGHALCLPMRKRGHVVRNAPGPYRRGLSAKASRSNVPERRNCKKLRFLCRQVW